MKESSKLIVSLLNEISGDDHLYLTLVQGIWPRAVGDQLAARSRPRAWQGGRLTVAVPSAEWRENLILVAEDLLHRLKAQLGDPRILGLDFIVDKSAFPAGAAVAAPPDPPAPCPTQTPGVPAECIADPELQVLFRRTVAQHLAARRDADEPPSK